MTSWQRVLAKELRSLSMTGLYDSKVTLEMDSSDFRTFTALLRPKKNSPFDGALIPVEFTIDSNYPRTCPKIKIKHDIYHPNVGTKGTLCFSMLDQWNSDMRIEHLINGILWLLDNPNPGSPLRSKCSDLSLPEFKKNVQLSMWGQTVKNTSYQPYVDFSNFPAAKQFSSLVKLSPKNLTCPTYRRLLASTFFGDSNKPKFTTCSRVCVSYLARSRKISSKCFAKVIGWKIEGYGRVITITQGTDRVHSTQLLTSLSDLYASQIFPSDCNLISNQELKSILAVGKWKYPALPLFQLDNLDFKDILICPEVSFLEPLLIGVGGYEEYYLIQDTLAAFVHALQIQAEEGGPRVSFSPRSLCSLQQEKCRSVGVHYKTKPGEIIKVVGSSDSLGKWNPSAGKELKYYKDDFWFLPACPMTVEDKWKFVMLNHDNNQVVWEPGVNRCHFTSSLSTLQHWGETQEGLPLSTRA